MAEKPGDTMMVVDENGRPMRIPRREWVEKILPENLKRAKDDPEALHQMIAGALREKLAENEAVGEAVTRLKEIDPNAERAAVVNGIYLMQRGRAAEAEAWFDEYLKKQGDSGAILTNLAKLYFERGEKERAETTLRRALAINPNLDSGMAWYASMHRERGGEEGYLAALRELAAEPKSWRPQLWLARNHLRNKRMDEAAELYRQVLSKGDVEADGLVQITGDLGTAGEIGRMLELVLPVYDVEKYGSLAGLNLINSLAQTGRMDEARKLLGKLQAKKEPAMAPLLLDMARRLAAAGAATPASNPPARDRASSPPAAGKPAAAGGEQRVKVAAVPLFNPIWTPPLGKPQWLVPVKTSGLKVAFFSLGDATRAAGETLPAREPASSRLTRSLPMYLAESLRLRSSAVTVCVIPVLHDTGAAVTATPWPLPQMLEACPKEFAPDIVVCGVVARGARGARAELHLFRVRDRQPLKTLRIQAGDDFSGTAVRAESDLMAYLAESGVTAEDSELKPPGRVDAYLDCLDDLLTHMLAASNVVATSALRNEREMFEGYFALAREEENSPLPALVVAAGVLAGIKCGSAVAEGYREAILELIGGKAGKFSSVRRISPVIYQRLGDEAAFEKARVELGEGAEANYREWLDGLAD